LLLSGATVFAQSAEPAPAHAPAPEAAAPPAGAPPSADAASFTDEQINDFASAMVQIQGVAEDATIADSEKQTQMVAIVQGTGLDPETFNAIGAAAQSDPALQERLQLAFASAQGPTQAQ
jgi:hypothetical protein